nr:cation-translocating P-type ATPase C-terminal domain-containing protein [Halopenitus persicus]
MERPPRDPDQGIVDRRMLGLVGGAGTVSTVVVLGLMFSTLGGAAAITPYVMTMVFTGFVALEFEKLYVIRWLRETPTFSNPWLAFAVGVSVLLQLAVLDTSLNQYFGTVSLGLADWLLLGTVLAVTLPGYFVVVTANKRYLPLVSMDGDPPIRISSNSRVQPREPSIRSQRRLSNHFQPIQLQLRPGTVP